MANELHFRKVSMQMIWRELKSKLSSCRLDWISALLFTTTIIATYQETAPNIYIVFTIIPFMVGLFLFI